MATIRRQQRQRQQVQRQGQQQQRVSHGLSLLSFCLGCILFRPTLSFLPTSNVLIRTVTHQIPPQPQLSIRLTTATDGNFESENAPEQQQQQQQQQQQESDASISKDNSINNDLKLKLWSLYESDPEWKVYMDQLEVDEMPSTSTASKEDALWELIKSEAAEALLPEPEAGPQLYQGILSKPSLIDAVVTIIAHEIETELIPATSIKNLFVEMLTEQDERSIHLDVMAVALRSPSVGNFMTATLFHRGFHALVCYRVGHRLWQAGRTGLAYYMQSVVSRQYSADIHPAALLGGGIYLNTGGGVVIGETAVVGQDTTILQGVTLGGTGKEAGNRHPKVGKGVILHPGASVLGNIPVGDGAVITAKSIVNKPVPPLARMNGVPAKIVSYREVSMEEFDDADLEKHLAFKYLEEWQEVSRQRQADEQATEKNRKEKK